TGQAVSGQVVLERRARVAGVHAIASRLDRVRNRARQRRDVRLNTAQRGCRRRGERSEEQIVTGLDVEDGNELSDRRGRRASLGDSPAASRRDLRARATVWIGDLL